MTAIRGLIEALEADFDRRLPGYHKSRREGLVTLAAAMLEVRSPTIPDLAAGLPRLIRQDEDRSQYVERLLGNTKIGVDAVMAAYAREVLTGLASSGRAVVLQLDQTHVNPHCEVLMLSARLGGRAVPIAWRTRATQGGIGFNVQEDLLNTVKPWLPEGAPVMLAADRFYGTPSLIAWCQDAGWGDRIRLKGNLTLTHEGGAIATGEAVTLTPGGLTGAELCHSGGVTNIGIIHEKGHKEPWLIAMDGAPTRARTLDYGMRWGIEAMFSDFKSRGFGLEGSQIHRPDRLDRLLLVMAIAVYWAISTGMFARHKTGGIKRGP